MWVFVVKGAHKKLGWWLGLFLTDLSGWEFHLTTISSCSRLLFFVIIFLTTAVLPDVVRMLSLMYSELCRIIFEMRFLGIRSQLLSFFSHGTTRIKFTETRWLCDWQIDFLERHVVKWLSIIVVNWLVTSQLSWIKVIRFFNGHIAANTAKAFTCKRFI